MALEFASHLQLAWRNTKIPHLHFGSRNGNVEISNIELTAMTFSVIHVSQLGNIPTNIEWTDKKCCIIHVPQMMSLESEFGDPLMFPVTPPTEPVKYLHIYYST